MSKEVLIYGSIDECSSAEFIEEINEQLEEDSNSEFVVRINTNGGSPEYSWGMIAKFSELTANKKVKIDGKAYSMGLFFACYVENAIALDVSQFLLHRAAYPSWFENDPNLFDDASKQNLANINKNLRAALEAKIDVQKFENLKSVKAKNITLDMVFSMDSRIDVPLTAKEAKQIGLINEIVTITPSIKAEIELKVKSKMTAISASYNASNDNSQINQPIKNKSIMTIETIKAEHPDVYAKIVAIGVAKEKDRVGSIMAFNSIDAEAVKKIIDSGEYLTETQRSEFTVKAMTKTMTDSVKADAPKAVVTAEPVEAKTEKEAELENFLAEVKKV